MPTGSIYFPSTWTQDDVNNFMAELAAIAERHGYTTTRGRGAGRGNVRELLGAINGGEMALVLLSDEERGAAITALRELQGTYPDWIARSAFGVIADALAEAREREEED